MKKWFCCFVFSMLGISIRGLSQKEIYSQLIGKWYSINRPDTMTLRFTNDTAVYFETKTKDAFTDKPFSYVIYKIDKQLMMDLIPPGSNFHMKLLLWVNNLNEIVLQGVDAQDYDNPLKDIPKQTDKNTFRLNRLN